MASNGSPNPGITSLTSLATSLTDINIPARSKPPTTYTQRPSRLTKTQQPSSPPLKPTTRSIPVSSVSELPKSQILPTARNISIFSTLGTACIIACIALVLLKNVGVWVTISASVCGALGAALYIQVALLVSARFRCKILDEECTIADMIEANKDRRRRGLSWDLRGIGKKENEQDNDQQAQGVSAERRLSMANQDLEGVSSSMTSINEEDDGYDEKDVIIEVAVKKPVPIATSFPVHRV